MNKLIKYTILFIFLNGSLAIAKNQPSGIWVGKINCNHERSEFSLEIIENDINLQIAQQSYKGSASFERKKQLQNLHPKKEYVCRRYVDEILITEPIKMKLIEVDNGDADILVGDTLIATKFIF